jgi:membrane protein DedA with SNARE-associated domain
MSKTLSLISHGFVGALHFTHLINTMYATALAAFIAATIGSFLGAYFKEYLFDRFNKNRRKREIRIELVKNLSKFYA